MRKPARVRMVGVWSAAAAGYLLLACVLTWPLPLHLQTTLLGDPSGDTGVYVWNLWIFRHELLAHGHLPFSTDYVFGYTGGADFALHNFAPIAGILGVPLISGLGVVGAFNVALLAFLALAGLGVFVLARRLALNTWPAWCAGALFMASPVLTARETAHFSLVLAAPLPLFLWALLRTLDTERNRDAVLVGALVAAASYSDAYYGIYCVLMGSFLVAWRFTRVEWRRQTIAPVWLTRALDLAVVAIAAGIAWRLLRGPSPITIGPLTIPLKTLYTPMLMLVGLLALRAWLAWRPIVRLHDPDAHLKALARLGLVAISVCLVLLLPTLVGLAIRFATNRLPDTTTFWRSSPRGLDVLAYVVPNPNHAWFGERTRAWFLPDRPDAFPEFIGSFSIVALGVIALGAWRRRLPGFWVAFSGLFIWLSLGPFLHVAGVNTEVVGLWALLRYIPVIGMARSPSRFAVVGALGLSLLFAFALRALPGRRPTTRWTVAVVLVLALATELIPGPRPLYAVTVPEVYRLATATGDDPGRLLELPTGIRDGTSSLGNFSAAAQFYQTRHRRPLIGGYLSRVSQRRKTEALRAPMLRALFALSEGRDVTPALMRDARATREAFLRRSCVKFVVVDKRRASDALRQFAVDALGLTRVYADASYELFTPVNPPRCEPHRRRSRRAWRDIVWLQTQTP